MSQHQLPEAPRRGRHLVLHLKRALFTAFIAAALATAGATADARISADVSAGALNLGTVLKAASRLGACPPEVTNSTCASRTGEGLVPGIGSVTEAYTWISDIGPPSCAEAFGITRAYPVTFVVAGKGEIHFAIAGAAQCVSQEAVRTQGQAFTVTGGTGIYAGASGSGTVERKLGTSTDTGRSGSETWTGTLSVAGMEFDTTPPVISGTSAKTVRTPRQVRRVRVTYNLTARDDVDGSVPVTCQPASGSRFKIGRTVVTCSATDMSANTATASFRVTVRRR
jgi:hypothetical protein